jgi:hypothetical protein
VSPGPVTVRVVDPLGEGELEGAFTYFSPVTLTSISPNVGTTEGGTAIALEGSDFNAEMNFQVARVEFRK